MTSTRTDAHKPSVAEPADYRQLGVFYQGNSDDYADAYSSDMREVEENLVAAFPDLFQEGDFWNGEAFFDGWFVKTGQCDCCGARFAHGAVYLHQPSNKVICVGHDCASNLFSFEDRNAAVRSRAVKVAKERAQLAKTKAEFLAADSKNAEAVAYLEAWDNDAKYNSFYGDLLGKFQRWGNLSEKQVEAVLRGRDRDIEKASEPAEETAPVIEGRITVTGVVLTTKVQESHYGEQLKMLVKDDRHFKVWGTIPNSIWGVKRDDRVSFSATVEKSDNDETFGFFKRPTKAIVIPKEEDVA